MIESIEDPAPNIRSESYLIATAMARCPGCRQATRVVALMVPPGHETQLDDDDETAAAWESASRHAFLFYLELIPDTVRRRLRRIAPGYRYALSPATHGFYWANHCERCGQLQEDHDVFCEPEGAFLPAGPQAAERIGLQWIGEPLRAAAAGYALDPEFIEPPVAP